MINLLNFILAIDSTLVAVLVVIGVVIIVSTVAIFIVNYYNKNKKKEEEKTPEKPKPVKEAPVKLTSEEKQAIKEEKAKAREENEKHEANRRVKALSELAIERRNDYFVAEDPNGVEAVGIIFNKKSKVYMFGPKGYKLNVGDVVIVKDLSGIDRQVPVVVPNRMVNEADLVQPFKDIEDIVYQTSARVDYNPVEVKEEPKADIKEVDVAFFYDSRVEEYEVHEVTRNQEEINQEVNKLLEENNVTYEVLDKKEFDEQYPYVDLVRFELSDVTFVDGAGNKNNYSLERNQEEILKESKKLLRENEVKTNKADAEEID